MLPELKQKALIEIKAGTALSGFPLPTDLPATLQCDMSALLPAPLGPLIDVMAPLVNSATARPKPLAADHAMPPR